MISSAFLVIGGGESGICTALKLAKLNHKVTLIEENEIGGSWLYSLEYPFGLWSKFAKYKNLESKKNLTEINDEERLYLNEEIAKVNAEIQAKMDSKQKEIIRDLKKYNVDIIYGKANFISKSLVEVNSENYHEIINFKDLIICTGNNQINMPDLAGIDQVNFLYQHNIFSIKEIPKSLVIIGCTLFNLEIAHIYSSLGCKVEIIEAKSLQQILRFFDYTCLNWAFKELLSKGVLFSFESKIVKIANHNTRVKLLDNNKKTFLTDQIFIFAKENFEGDRLGLGKIGIKFDKNGIVTSQNGQTIQRNIYAIGNCAQNYNKNNLQLVINGFLEKFSPSEDKKSNSLVIFGSNMERKNIVIHTINFDNPIVNLGMSYLEAETRWGAVIHFEIYKSFFDSGFVKLIFNSVNGQALGIGLTGQIAAEFLLAMKVFLSKSASVKEIKTFLVNNRLNCE